MDLSNPASFEDAVPASAAIPPAKSIVFWVLIFLLAGLWAVEFLFYWNVITTDSVLTSNIIVVCTVPAMLWILASMNLASQRPQRSLLAIFGGLVTVFWDLSPAVRMATILYHVGAIAFSLSMAYIDTMDTFRVLMTAAMLCFFASSNAFSIMASSSKMMVVKGGGPLLAPSAIVVSSFIGPLATFCDVRIWLLEFIVATDEMYLASPELLVKK